MWSRLSQSLILCLVGLASKQSVSYSPSESALQHLLFRLPEVAGYGLTDCIVVPLLLLVLNCECWFNLLPFIALLLEFGLEGHICWRAS